jgi:twitching motility protein PilI
MGDLNIINPVAILKDIEESCRCCAVGLPHKAEVSNEWSGIAFRLDGNSLLVPMEQVVEILDYPVLSAVPLTQPWVRGIANIRGNLLPVIDLNGYLGNALTQVTDKTRVLVIDYEGLYSGLVVDEVMGLKHFLDEEYTEDGIEVGVLLQPYAAYGYRRNEQVWGVFSLFALADSRQFLQAAV